MTSLDWTAIKGHYLAGQRSVRSIAAEFGITDTAIRKRAKAAGWVRDAAGTKREIVRRAMAGSRESSQFAAQTIEAAAAQDIADLERGLRIHRHCLMALEQSAETCTEPREVKVIVDAAGAAIDAIRRIRGLEDPSGRQANDNDDEGRAAAIADRLEQRQFEEIARRLAREV
jgi:predicted transcriptional regulator